MDAESRRELSLDEMDRISGGAARKYIIYTVMKGDTLTTIARRYHVTEDDLVGWNHISNPNLITVGMQLKIYL